MTIRTGLERILDDCPADLRGRRVGLLTNHAGLDENLRPAPVLLHEAGDINLTRLFAPEHGLYGEVPAGVPVQDRRDPATGLDVVSLFGPNRSASPEMVEGLDLVLVDLPDIGSRYYTLLGTTMSLLAACRTAGVQVVVLDRPNPLGGRVEGQRAVAPRFRSLVGAVAAPIRHGLTLGEQCLLAAREAGQEDSVRVVAMEGWRRSMRWPDLGRPWVPLSPNTDSYDMAQLYPGTCLIEGTNLSEGRGTASPFIQMGAPWLDAFALARELEGKGGEGVWYRPAFFLPTYSKHAGSVCQGVMMHVDPRMDVDVLPGSLHAIAAMMRHPESQFLPARGDVHHPEPAFDLLSGDDRLRLDLAAGKPVEEILADWDRALADWPDVRATVSLYPD